MTQAQYSDVEIVQALLCHNERITRDFFYRKCYPLFKSIYDNYYTDCASCLEFINEIYLHIMTPDEATGTCKLQHFRHQSTLCTWIKTVSLFYCYKHFQRHRKAPTENFSDNYDEPGVRIDHIAESISIDSSSLDNSDVENVLQLMPNKRYSMLIRYRYLLGHTNEETAEYMGMRMAVYYNKHKLAKEQYVKILKKETLI